MPNASILKWWQTISVAARFGFVASIAVIVLAALLFSISRDAQTPLFARPLLADQLSEVETHLAAWNVAFSAASDNVVVASKHRNDILLRLSLAGIPRSHIASSSETLAKVGALTPQSVLDAQSRDGLAGDLALGLRGITGIADANVIIAPASPGYFADQTSHEASASVRVTLQPGVSLSPETVNGIKTFVAAGVPGLDQSHVAVVDDRGVALSGRAASGDGEARSLQESIQTALDQVVGPGRSIVRAHVDVSRRHDVRLETKRTPALAKPVSNTSIAERYQNGSKHYSKVQSAADSGSDVVQRETESEPGETQRVSIAVFLDQTLTAQIARIKTLVESAGGIDYARGDTVSVQPIALAGGQSGGLPLAPSGATVAGSNAAAPAAALPVSPLRDLLATYLPALPPLIIVLAWLGLLLLLAKPIAAIVRSFLPAPMAEAPAATTLGPGLPPEAIHRALQGEPAYAAATVIASLPTATAAAVPNSIRTTNAAKSSLNSRARGRRSRSTSPSRSRVPEPFRSFASIFAERDVSPARERLSSAAFERTSDIVAAAESTAAPVGEPSPPPLSDERVADLLDTFVAELARLRARVTERFEERAEAMLADLARNVLARELATAPVAIEALVAGSLEELAADARIVIRVSTSDAQRLHGRYAVAADETLGPGDFAVDVDDGRYDAALQTRLDALLASHRISL